MARRTLLLFLVPLLIEAQDTLPHSAPWTDPPSDLAAQQYAELRAFYEKRFLSSMPAPPDRNALKRTLGIVDAFLPPKPVRKQLAEVDEFTLSLVEWPILRIGSLPATGGASSSVLRMYGLLWEPKGNGPFPAIVAFGDTDANRRFLTPRANAITFAPLVPLRRKLAQPWLANDREWLLRLAYQTGRHIAGSEVQQASSAADFLLSLPTVDPNRLEVAGAGHGGMIAMFAGALDVRFSAVRSQGWLDDPTPDWELPEDRILWGFRSQFTRDSITELIRPRELAAKPLIVGWENVQVPELESIDIAQFRQWETFYRNRVLESERLRDAVEPLARKQAYWDMVGRYPPPEGPLEPVSVKVMDEPRFTGHRLRVRVYDGVHATGILLVPKDLKPGEKRPVVFVQHGLGGRPEDSINDPKVYASFGRRLAERGYIVFAGMISTQDMVERHKLVRRAHWLGLTPAGMEVQKFNRVIDYLETLRFADRDRIAFYGLSYGGFTALWTGPGVDRFRAVISSGHFNHWANKTTDPTLGTSYMLYPDVLDMYGFGVLNVLDHSGLAALLAPRPFMVEMGDLDGVIVEPRSLVEREFEQVKGAYRAIGAEDRARIARFNGPHRVDGVEAFQFLDEVLGWKPTQ